MTPNGFSMVGIHHDRKFHLFGHRFQHTVHDLLANASTAHAFNDIEMHQIKNAGGRIDDNHKNPTISRFCRTTYVRFVSSLRSDTSDASFAFSYSLLDSTPWPCSSIVECNRPFFRLNEVLHLFDAFPLLVLQRLYFSRYFGPTAPPAVKAAHARTLLVRPVKMQYNFWSKRFIRRDSHMVSQSISCFDDTLFVPVLPMGTLTACRNTSLACTANTTTRAIVLLQCAQPQCGTYCSAQPVAVVSVIEPTYFLNCTM